MSKGTARSSRPVSIVFIMGISLVTAEFAVPASSAPNPVLQILHNTSVIPPRALEALIQDPLDLFTTDGVPEDERMNVGIQVRLELSAPGKDIQWIIPGAIIKDYSIAFAREVGEGFLTECMTSALSVSDLQQDSLSYYYTEPGVSIVMVSALVDGMPMMAAKTFVVERNPKAEIFYATGDGGGGDDTPVEDRDNIIGEHLDWHLNIEGGAPAGEFFRFHRGYIQKFNCWRGIFGYPCVAVYATAPSYVPTGDEVDHAGIPGDGNGIINAPRNTSHQDSITELPERFTIAGDGVMSLADFSNEDELSESIIQYHNDHHGFICHTGDFTPPRTTPADPIFWRFHLMLTKVHSRWQFLELMGTIIAADATDPNGALVFFPDPDLITATGCEPQKCDFDSGDVFPIGFTTVTCTVQDVMILDVTFPDDPGLNQGTTTEISFTVMVQGDFDGDGVQDDQDDCLESDLSATIVIGSCDSGVDNMLFGNGCTMADLIQECADAASNHGEFVSCVAQLASGWRADGLISGQDMGKIQSCAARARADLNQDSAVATQDLLILLGLWGTAPDGPPDFDDDNNVGSADLLVLLQAWGPLP